MINKEFFPQPNQTIAVWFSCGAASAVAAKLTLKKYRKICNIRVINNPVKEEDSDNRRFLSDIENWIRLPIEIVSNSEWESCSADEVWRKKRFMSSNFGAPCTVELKKRARQQWESKNRADYHVLGFTFEEIDRYDRFIQTERENVIPILIDARLTKEDCMKILQKRGIRLPRVYSLGYPNANCIGCVKASSPTYWNHVRKVNPEVFEARAKLSRELGAKLVRVKNERIFLDELDPHAVGRQMKSMNFECGIFCEEK